MAPSTNSSLNEQAAPTANKPDSLDGKIIVIKFGGKAIEDDSVIDSLVDDTIVFSQKGAKIIVVHGGGTAVTTALAAIGKKTEKFKGLRITDSETLAIAVKTFAEINARLTEKFTKKGASALGFSSQAGNPFKTQKLSQLDENGKDVELGWVGEVVAVDATPLERWVWSGWIPVIAPIGLDSEGNYYNLNADHAALAIAQGMLANRLMFLTDVPGVMKNIDDLGSRISHLTPSIAKSFIDDGTITGGMLPKIKSCIAGIKNGLEQIAILNSFEPHVILHGISAPEQFGTLIKGES